MKYFCLHFTCIIGLPCPLTHHRCLFTLISSIKQRNCRICGRGIVFLPHEKKPTLYVFKRQLFVLSWKIQIIEEVLQVLVVILQTENLTGIPKVFKRHLP
jgi:hypothetical protein